MRLTMILFYMLSLLMINEEMSFKEDQLRYPRVRTAYSEKGEFIEALLKDHKLAKEDIYLFIRAIKDVEILEVWVSGINHSMYSKLIEYPFCSSSGELGPKRMQGDGQIPEGYYYIDRFNPASNFYLSLGINYPNRSDKIKGNSVSPGGDIFIHGSCVTIGCIPITDEKIKELYILAVEARNNGQLRIPVHIFPSRMDADGLHLLKHKFQDEERVSFWNQLSEGYMYFENHLKIPEVSISQDGEYMIN